MKSEICVTPFAVAIALTLLSCRLGGNPASTDDENNLPPAEKPEILFTLYQNDPNPFQNTTLIRFRLEKKLGVHLKVGGKTVLNEVRDGPAVHYVVYEAPAELPGGEYACVLEASGRYQLITMVLQR